jgi:N6-adenosine-specific RNA methylase IME4
MIMKKLEDKQEGGITIGTYRHTKKSGECILVELRGNIINFNGRKAEIIVTILPKRLTILKLLKNRIKH